jgi:hypothetical protein
LTPIKTIAEKRPNRATPLQIPSWPWSTLASLAVGRFPFRIQELERSGFLSQIIVQARHQYVLSYVSNNEIPGMLAVNRKIEVKVNRSDVKVLHRKSYLQYPSPKQ